MKRNYNEFYYACASVKINAKMKESEKRLMHVSYDLHVPSKSVRVYVLHSSNWARE